MRDFAIPPPDIEAQAKLLDPDAWRSSDTSWEAFDLRRRRYKARAKLGWTTDRYPLGGEG